MSPQDRIAELEEQVAFYKSELGLSLEQCDLACLRKAFGLSPHLAGILLVLYQNGDRPASWHFLDEAVPASKCYERADPYRQIQVRICHLRKALGGYSALENVWGVGFRLPVETRSRIAALLDKRAAA